MTTTTIRIEVDDAADAAYIRLSGNAVARTDEVTEDVLVDLDDMSVVVGIEVLVLAADIPFSELVTRYHVHSDVIETLRRIRPSVAGFVFKTSPEGTGQSADAQTLQTTA